MRDKQHFSAIEDQRQGPQMSQNGKDKEGVVPVRKGLTLDEVRARLNGKTGKKYWRSLEELADTPEFHEMLRSEFPQQSSEWIDSVSRGGFLKMAGASLALAGLAGCT